MGTAGSGRQSQFFEWLSRSVSPALLSELYQAFTELEESLSAHRYMHHLTQPLSETTDGQAVQQLLRDLTANQRFMDSWQARLKLTVLRHYAAFCAEQPAGEQTPEVRPVSTGDALLDRLRQERIPYVDQRSKGGALWLTQTAKTDALVQEARAMGMRFSYSSARGQWWTRDATPVKPKGAAALNPDAVKRNRTAFCDWLRQQGHDQVDVFSYFGTARKIHQLLIAEGYAPGLFGIEEPDQVQVWLRVVRQKGAFITGDRQERRFWTTTANAYLSFAQSGSFPAAQPAPSAGTAPEARQAPSAETAPEARQAPSAETAPEDTVSEAGFRAWLARCKPEAQADGLVAALRGAETFAQRNHLSAARLFGVAPAAMRTASYRLTASNSFARGDARLYAEFRSAAPLLSEYAGTLPASAEKPPEAPARRDAAAIPVEELLQGEELALLRQALLESGVRTAADLQHISLYPFMNERELYSIGQRTQIVGQIKQMLSELAAPAAGGQWELATAQHTYAGATPAQALLAYCQDISGQRPTRFRTLIGQKMDRTDAVPLMRSPLRETDAAMSYPECAIDGSISGDTALAWARWICAQCLCADPPTGITPPPAPPADTLSAEGAKGPTEAGAHDAPPAAEDTDPAPAAEGAGGLTGAGAPAPQPAAEDAAPRPGRLARLDQKEDYAHTKPLSLTFRGQTFAIANWKDLYQEVCWQLYGLRRKQLLQLVNSSVPTGLAAFFASEQSRGRLREPREFAPECYFESNLSATETMRRIVLLLDYFGLTREVEIRYQRFSDILQPDAPQTPAVPVVKYQPETSNPEEDARPRMEEPSALQRQMEEKALAADLAGISLDELYRCLPSANMAALRRARDASSKLIDMDDRVLHMDALMDVEAAADQFHDIMERLLNRNGGYAAFTQFYSYVRAELPMFLNDNDLADEKKVYCVARHLLGKLGWHGQRYAFNGNNLSREGAEAVTGTLDVCRLYAREQQGFFRFDELEAHLQQRGIKTGNLRGTMRMGSQPIFFYYSEDEIITQESMGIDEGWLEQARGALNRLFADQGDHVVLRAIHPRWYTQLPALPGLRPWTPLLLQSLLPFYQAELGARTVKPELSQHFHTLHAMLVTLDSPVQTFADAVAAFLVDSGVEQRRFHQDELRRLLTEGRLMDQGDLYNRLQKAIGPDPRFAWDAAGENVTVRV